MTYRRLAALAVFACAAAFAISWSSSAFAAGTYAPVYNWTEQGSSSSTDGVSDVASAYDEANGELVYFGGSTVNDRSNETWTWDGSSWTRKYPAHSPGARNYASMAFNPETGTVLLYGGFNGFESLNDTWSWNGNDWTQLTPATSPPGLFSASMAFDASSGEMLLFGGVPAAEEVSNETWSWNGGNWTKLTPAHSPPAQASALMSFDQANGKVLLYGGANGTWTWNGSDWTQMQSANTPGTAAAMDFNPALGSIMLFGGNGSGGSGSNTTWSWDGSNWTELQTADSPSGRRGPGMNFDPSTGEMVMFGGFINGNYVTDTWTYGPPAGVSANWSEKSPANHPSARSDAGLAFDPGSGKTLLFGGWTGWGTSDETWTWDGQDWTQEAPAHKPPVRSDAVMTYDPARGEMLLYGGHYGDYRGDTWIWDGSDWTEKHPSTSPPSLSSAASAFDPSIGQVVVFGGYHNNVVQNETWTWNGSSWTKQNPANSPTPRAGAQMAFDPTIGKAVLFGGYNGDGWVNETWLWDGGSWARVYPDHDPSPREATGMAFDPSLGKIVLFGGHPGSSDATWTWDGSDWQQQTPATVPTGRSGSAMSFDPSTGEVLLFGGVTGNPPNRVVMDDTWTYSLSVGPPTAAITAPAGGGIYTVGETVIAEFECEESLGAPGIASCEDSNGDPAPAGTLDTSTLGPNSYTVTATSENGQTGDAQIDYTVEQAEPAIATSGAVSEAVVGSTLSVEAELTGGYQPTGGTFFRAYGPDDPTCSGTPAFESDPVAVSGNGTYSGSEFTPAGTGSYRWVASYDGDLNNQTAASGCGDPGSVTEIAKASPALASNSASDGELGAAITVKASLSGGHLPGGGIVYRAYGPDAADCSGTPAFESSPAPVTGTGDYTSPAFTPTEPGTYRWVASYDGDADNEAAMSACGEAGSVSTITKTPTPPPPPGYKCPKARPDLKLTGFGLKPPFGKAKPVFGVRVAFKSKNAIVKFNPSMTYRLSGKKRSVKLKTRTVKVNGQRYLRFRAPNQLLKDFRKVGLSLRQAPVTFKVRAQIRPRGSRAKCFRNLGTRKLKTRLVNVSDRVALRRLLGF